MENSILYLFGFSPFQGTQLNNLFEVIKLHVREKVKISIVLLHDGVIGTSKKGKIPISLDNLLKLPIEIKAMRPDLSARGINPSDIVENVEAIEYTDLVDLIVSYPKIMSWM